jgi:hypothetical protein
MTQPDDAATGYGFANQYVVRGEKGLTKREHFAALAMQGILASKIYTDSEVIAEFAIDCADDLIEFLNLSNQSL